MIELHGWFTLREAFRECDESGDKFANAIHTIERAIEEIPTFNLLIHIKVLNGFHYLLINGNFNHRNSRWTQVEGLLHQVAEVAPGSYGLLHWHNDEDADGFDNVVQVYVLKKGRLEKTVDNHLSPYFPAVEENNNLEDN